MPRYNALDVVDLRILENPVGVRTGAMATNYRALDLYSNIPPDAKVDWSGDIIFDDKSEDIDLVYTVESYVQNLYFRLVTQLGEHPENADFGWNWTYLYNLTVMEQEKILPSLVKDVKSAIEKDTDTLSVLDVTAYTQRMDNHTHNIIIEVTVIPRTINDTLQVVFQLDGNALRGSGA